MELKLVWLSRDEMEELEYIGDTMTPDCNPDACSVKSRYKHLWFNSEMDIALLKDKQGNRYFLEAYNPRKAFFDENYSYSYRIWKIKEEKND